MLNKIIIACLIFCAFYKLANSQTISPDLYKGSTIPDSLKENANAVVRYSENIITVKGPGKERIRVHNIIAILNEKGDKEAEMVMGYNKKYDEYSNIEMRVYNDKGAVIKKYHKSDMYDGSAAGDETMVTNERFLAVRHTVASYPTTIDIEYEEDLSSFISLDGWNIQNKMEKSVEHAVCKVTIDPSMGFRYKSENIAINPVKTDSAGLSVYKWDVKNLKAI